MSEQPGKPDAKAKVLVAGATGYTGALAASLVWRHPQLELAAITSRSETGTRLSDLYPRHQVPMTRTTGSSADTWLPTRTAAPGATFSALPSEPVPAAGRAVPDEQPRLLTPRELEVLHLVGDGVATRDVAARLGISQHTVRKHVQTILGKLDAHSKLEGVARARRLGLLDRTGPADLDD